MDFLIADCQRVRDWPKCARAERGLHRTDRAGRLRVGRDKMIGVRVGRVTERCDRAHIGDEDVGALLAR